MTIEILIACIFRSCLLSRVCCKLFISLLLVVSQILLPGIFDRTAKNMPRSGGGQSFRFWFGSILKSILYFLGRRSAPAPRPAMRSAPPPRYILLFKCR